MIRKKRDLLYLLGVDSASCVAAEIQRSTSTPTYVELNKSGVTIGPLLDDYNDNRQAQVSLNYPFYEEEWQRAIESVESFSERFLGEVKKGLCEASGLMFTDMVDRQISHCIDCGQFMERRGVVCDLCASRPVNLNTSR
tara:strand:+ start:504 stop:920 length:417 start_codon:yes stop_codon:yes gene_type:complete